MIDALSPVPRRGMTLGAIRWPTVAFWGGFAILSLPTLYENFQQSWSLEQGQAGPIVLALGLWLLWRRWPEMRAAATPSSGLLSSILGLGSAVLYVFGRVSDQFLIESYALYAFVLVGLYALLGWRSLVQGWFPLAYLVFALPTPYSFTWTLTSHLRLWITQGAVTVYQSMGFTIVRDGLNILVDQYELAVKDACSGMNSLISLSAIGLVYLHIRQAPPWWYFAVMFVPIVGFALLGNFSRVMILIALTHYFGDAVAQSFLHETAGIVTFVVALVGLMALDGVVAPQILKHKKGV